MTETSAGLHFKSAHFIGIGGAGMSGIALVLHERGCNVTGSDLKASRYVRALKAAGIEVRLGHSASTIDEVSPDIVVISSAIPETNPELVRARELGITVWQRARMLAALGSGRKTIAIAGTHGKTTTSSMCASMLGSMGLDPTFLIGGVVEQYGTNGRNGRGEFFVAEADESDGSFLYLDPNIVVVTNVEADHLDHYGTMENLEDTFVKFMRLVGRDGTLIVCGDNPHLVELARLSERRMVTYGFTEGCDYRCVVQAPSDSRLESSFEVYAPHGEAVHVTLHVNPGLHNVLNASATIAVADACGLNLAEAARALSGFSGVRRRFTHVGDVSGITVVDDYGHHPTEIRATLTAASSLDFPRIVVVFQPHRYSRTAALMDEFAHAFSDADLLYVMDIFSAGEMSIPGVTSKALAHKIAATPNAPQVCYVRNRNDLLEELCKACQPGDLLITLGAGDVTNVGPSFIEAMEERAESSSDS